MKGVFVTDKTGLKIFVFINAMIFVFTTFVKNTPFYGKIASKVWKIYFQYISPHFLDAAGSQISDCVTQLKLDTVEKLSSSIFCLWVWQALVSPDQISTFSNIYRHTSPLLTMYHLISSSTNLYWPSTSQYRHILIQFHQVPLLIHHLDRHSSANWIISLFTTHLMSHAQYTWSSIVYICIFVD